MDSFYFKATLQSSSNYTTLKVCTSITMTTTHTHTHSPSLTATEINAMSATNTTLSASSRIANQRAAASCR